MRTRAIVCFVLILAAVRCIACEKNDTNETTTVASTTETELLTPNQAEHGCGPDCIFCGEDDSCFICEKLLLVDYDNLNRCVDSCPFGYSESWSTDERAMGRICLATFRHKEYLIGGCLGLLLSILIAATAAAYSYSHRCKVCLPLCCPSALSPEYTNRSVDSEGLCKQIHKSQRRKMRYDSQLHLSLCQKVDEDVQLYQHQLANLKPYAHTFLALLNSTRGQVRELYDLGNKDAAIVYSCVLIDLSKLLILLNKSEVPAFPDEWPRLASWAESLLKRYGQQSPSQEVNLLADFLQPETRPSEERQAFPNFKPSSKYNNPSPIEYNDDVYDKDLEMKIRKWNEDLKPPSYMLVEMDSVALADPWSNRPLVRRDSVWLEDETLKGTRPQDELITEL